MKLGEQELTTFLAQRRNRLAVAAVVMLFSLSLGFTSALRKSMTIDEFSILPNGLALLRTRDLSMDSGVPPLAKVLSALPLLVTNPVFNAAGIEKHHNSWRYGGEFAADNREHLHRHLMAGRCVSLLVFAGICLATAAYARRLYGDLAWLVALIVTAFSPNLLAHGRLVTTDIYFAAAVLAFLFACSLLQKAFTPKAAVWAGLALGAACLCKLTGLVFCLLFPVFLLMSGPFPERNGPAVRRWLGQRALCLATGTAVTILTVNAGYLFSGVLTPLRDYAFTSGAMKTITGMMPGALPVPLPFHFVKGIDVQLTETGYPAYVLGRTSTTGFWYYYVVCILTKLPIATLGLTVVATLIRPKAKRCEIPLLLASLGPLVFFSLGGHKNIGIRYLLFIVPILAVWISRLTVVTEETTPDSRKAQYLAAAGGALWLAIASTVAWPHYLPFFNIACGGPDQGYRYLLDSNLDWGQDLIELRRFMQREGIPDVQLAYCGRVKPEYYDVPYKTMGTAPDLRYAAISANFLWGRMYFMNGTTVWADSPEAFAVLRDLVPLAVVGHTIYVYDLAQQPAAP